MTNFLKGIRNLVIGCLAVIGGLVVLSFLVYYQVNQPVKRDRPTATPSQAVPAETEEPTAELAPEPSPSPLPAVTPSPIPQIADVAERQAAHPQSRTFIPSIQAAPTLNATGTAKAIEIIAKATASAHATAEIATVEAVRANVTATAEQQRLDTIASTNNERINSPPDGTWCAGNSTRGICVSDFQYVDSFDFYEAPAGTRYIAFLVGVKNVGKSSISVNPYDATLVMSNGQTHSLAFGSYAYWDIPLDAVTVASGDTAIGGVLFRVAKGDAPERVIYRGGLWESEIVVDLTEPPME